MPAQPLGGLRIDDHPADGSHVVRLAGELDVTTAPGLETRMQRVSRETTQVILDLGEVSFVDSVGLAAILSCKKLCARSRCRFLRTRGSRQVERLFDLVGVSDSLPFAEPELDD